MKKETMIALSDLVSLLKGKKRQILYCMAGAALCTSFYALTRPLQYVSEATFRDKGIKSSDLGSSSFLQVLGGLPVASGSSESISLLSSRRLYAPVISKLGLQANVSKKSLHFDTLQKISDNLYVEYAHFRKSKEPITVGKKAPLLCREVAYSGETPKSFELVFISDSHFQVCDANKTVLQEGVVGESLMLDQETRFTLLLKPGEEIQEGAAYALSFEPMQNVYKGLLQASAIAVSKKDRSIVNLSLASSERLIASQFLNLLMAEYNHYLKEENDKFSSQQISYLNQREEEASRKLDILLEKHAESLSSEYSKTGFADADREMEFLGLNQAKSKQRLMVIELESKRLRNFQQDHPAYFDLYEPSGNIEAVLDVLDKIRLLKQKREILTLSLADIEQAHPSLEMSKGERSKGDFKGISLQAAEEIHHELSMQISTLQSTMRLTNHLLQEMENPAFEITAFSPMLEDPYSQEMMTKTAQLALAAKDVNNRTEREMARLREELALQKDSLRQHLKENNQLGKLEEQILTEKLHTIQTVAIELATRQISSLEDFLAEGVKIRIENLAQERKLVEEELQEMRATLSRLPNKWLAEHKLKQRLDLNKRMMDEVARLIESKNISYHLETIQSTPLDIAVAPLLPKSPRIVLFAFLGAFLGLLGSCSLLTLQTLKRGVRASPTNLKLADQFVAGSLQEDNLATLRRLATFLFLNERGKTTLLIGGKGSDYSQRLAELLAKQKRKVLLLNLDFAAQQKSGLLDYLEGKIATPAIQHGTDFDLIAAGGATSYAKELITSTCFTDLLQRLSQDYDHLIAVTSLMPLSPEAESYAQLFDSLAVTLSTETIQNLDDYLVLSNTKKVAYLF